MDRKDYISDNLIGLRDRLRQNNPPPPAAAETEPEPPPAAPSTETAAPVALTATQTVPAAAPAPVRREHDALRARSDLAARLARESAAMRAAAADFVTRSGRLEALATAYEKQLAALDQVTPEKCGAFFPKTVDDCRLEYFRLAGEADSLQLPGAGATGHPTPHTTGLSARDLRRALWIPALAMFAAGLVIAAAIALVFR